MELHHSAANMQFQVRPAQRDGTKTAFELFSIITILVPAEHLAHIRDHRTSLGQLLLDAGEILIDNAQSLRKQSVDVTSLCLSFPRLGIVVDLIALDDRDSFKVIA